MSNIFDVGVIGAGIAGAFAALRFSEQHRSAKTIVFDLGRPPGKRRRQLEGWLGCFPNGDGKIYTGDLDKVLNVVDGRKANPAAKWVKDVFSEINPTAKVVKDPQPSAGFQKRLREKDYSFQTNDYIQWKPESVHQLSRYMTEIIEGNTNLQFSFDNEVHHILKKKNVFHVSTNNGEFQCKKLIMCVGRSGWRWVTKVYKEFGLDCSDDRATFGIRGEISSTYLKDLNKSHCTISKENLEIGPFSWSGTVIPEDHADLVISGFRSNEDRWKSDKVSFSIIGSRFFKDKGVYETDRQAKLAFVLANDRVARERIKLLIKKDPSSPLAQLPEYDWLSDVLEELNFVIPNLIQKGYYHTPHVLPLAAQIKLGTNLESDMEGFFVAGESAGILGIHAAAIMGTIAADAACK